VRRVLSRTLAQVIQCVADFLVDDACHLCSVRHGGPPRELHRFQRAIAAPALVSPVPGVSVVNHPVCERCASGLETTRAREVLGPLPVDGGPTIRVHAPFRTNETLLRVIHLVKFGRLRSLLPGAAQAVALCAESAVRRLERPVIVPIPMDRRAVRQRGFNQSTEIGAWLGDHWGIIVAADALLKPHPTRPQSLTPPGERAANVRDAFCAGPGRVSGCDVLLVDDLVTTGATASAATVILAARGAASVTVASLGMAL
jgi:predicted amidophosphoribosyltransferase